MDSAASMIPAGRWARFLRKSGREKRAAVIATLRHAFRPRPAATQFPSADRWSPPAAVREGLPFYLAERPESDVRFGAYPEFRQLVEAWHDGNAARNAGDLSRLYALMMNVRQLLDEGVPGDFAELGVWRGNSAAVLAHYARAAHRDLLLFDTFEGFDTRDLTGLDRDRVMEFADTSLPAVRRLVGEERVRYLPGRFPESLSPEAERRTFSLVHLDCDLYEPIKAGMAFFFPRLSVHGLMIVHDYSGIYWDGVRKAVDAFLASRPERPVLMPDRSGTAIIRKVAG
jgi:hypothetical protein